jgi:hypothetical protein
LRKPAAFVNIVDLIEPAKPSKQDVLHNQWRVSHCPLLIVGGEYTRLKAGDDEQVCGFAGVDDGSVKEEFKQWEYQ